ncbi:DUF4189 domain-containing protein [Aliikangiella marina]|uniref:DUF4189 domain-containing protein n=1 Tax=Aliikangiella marina TaxID=1712262 RepID=A0A545T4J6_9GAMM|nr:DUF4189 domain-containing protein [Aliikangiella marina]TQV72115.1 DUF4189 domain-containing protein [Aliikangiella marina]
MYKILITVCFIFSLLITEKLKATPVPSELYSLEMLEGYLQYQMQNNNKAFYVSKDGSWGSSWNYGSQALAKKNALKNCQNSNQARQCMLVDLNGDIETDSVEYELLKKQLKIASELSWPLPDNKIPSALQGKPKLVKQYKRYLKHPGHKAFALADDTSWGYSNSKSVDSVAKSAALESCEKYTKKKLSCRLIDVNNQAIDGWVEEMPTIQSVNIETIKAIPQSIKMTYQLDDYLAYLARPYTHRAYAIKGANYSGYAINEPSIELARDKALEKCDYRKPNSCRIIAVDDQILEQTVSTKDIKRAPKKITATLPKPIMKRLRKSWHSYSNSKGHRAIAMSSLSIKSEAIGFIKPEYAIEYAMNGCKAMNEKWGTTERSCRIIIVNNQVDQDVVDYIMETVN